jgi:hypothetical protein
MIPPMARMLPRLLNPALVAFLFLGLTGCEQPRAHGDVHAVIVGAHPDLWWEIVDEFEDALSPSIQIVRDERIFRVTWQDPENLKDWGNLRRFRQVLVMGTEEDPWIADALAARGRGAEAVSAPAFLQVNNVWARGQQVSVLLLGASDQEAQALELVGSVQETLDTQYREFAVTRMFVSGENTALADSLAREVGFRLVLPAVYRSAARDSVYRFRNDNPSPAELIREVAVTWESPIPASLPTRAEMEAWRLAFSAEYYNDPQVLDTTLVSFREIEVGGGRGVELQAAWASPPGAWPAGGPFISQVIPCPAQDRLYRVDAWLYAPSREKYEYMIQLQTILNSFACTPSR